MSDHEGKHCEIEKIDAELTFSGHEWLGYDMSSNISATIRARRENLTLSFKTVHGTAVLFYAGDENVSHNDSNFSVNFSELLALDVRSRSTNCNL